MIKYLKPLEFFKEFLNGRDEWPSPVLVGLYVSDNYVSLAVASDSYLIAHHCGLYPVGNLDDLVEQLQSLKKSVDHKLRRIIVSSNNSVGNFESLKYTYLKDNLKSWRADLSGITFPRRHHRPQCYRMGNFEGTSALRMLQVGLDFLNTLVDRKNFYGKEDS
ncbi:hypothetical protein Q3G72_005044 [Acer saccharum]|nr:hypothetical protein Q3G72_005044 [Acer saccharum]